MTHKKKNFDGGRALVIGIGEGYCPSLQLPSLVRKDAEAVAQLLCDPTLLLIVIFKMLIVIY